MRIGMVSDSLGDLSLDDLLRTAAELGIEMLEFPCRQPVARAAADGLALSALIGPGDPLHPGEPGGHHRVVTSKTIRLAGLLGVGRVVMMSGIAAAIFSIIGVTYAVLLAFIAMLAWEDYNTKATSYTETVQVMDVVQAGNTFSEPARSDVADNLKRYIVAVISQPSGRPRPKAM